MDQALKQDMNKELFLKKAVTFKSKHRNITSCKQKIRIGTWNVRSTFEEGALKNLVKVMKRYRIDVLALQETKQRNNVAMQVDDYMFFNSGIDNRKFGVGFMVNDKFKQAVIEFEGSSDRFCRMRIKGKYRKINIINVHAPTEEKEEEVKDRFYEEVDESLNKLPKFDVKILLGDFNAKIGREAEYKEVTGGKSRHMKNNENGKKLVNLALENDFKIVSTAFEHKNIHKETWVSPNGKIRNQIDHILIEKKHIKLINDVRSYRGADADSDHFLVIADMKQVVPDIQKNRRKTRKLYNLQKLKDEKTMTKLQQEISEQLETEPCNTNIQEEWKKLETVMKEKTEAILGVKKEEKRKAWFDEECEKVLKERNIARSQFLTKQTTECKENYEIKRRAVKRLCRRKKRTDMMDKLQKIEDSYQNKVIRNFYQEIKNSKQRSHKTSYLKSKDNCMIGNQQEKAELFARHFREMLNSADGPSEMEYEVTDEEEEVVLTDELVGRPTEDEIRGSISRLKNNKSSGENNLPAEILKFGGDTLFNRLGNLLTRIWDEEEMPDNWSKALICPILKKGDKEKCSNYRGIALLDVAYKVLANILKGRLNEYHQNIVGEYQGGFKKGRSTVDQIFIMKQIMHSSYEQNLSLHMLFIDYKQAYDSVQREMLLKAMKYLQIPRKLRKLIEMTLTNSANKVLLEGVTSTEFGVKNGLRQGDPLSTILFNIVLEMIIRESGIRTTFLIYNNKYQCLAYADDLVLMTRSKEELTRIFKQLEETSKKYGLRINENKTKYMVMENNRKKGTKNLNIESKDGTQYIIEEVDQVEYLGVTMTNNGEEGKEIEKRISKGSKATGMLTEMLKAKNISRAAKIRAYQTIIRPSVTYACEAWTMNKNYEEKLERWERKNLRKIFGGIKLRDGEWRRRTNKEVMEIYKNPTITNIVKAQRTRWLGHIARMSRERWVKRVLTAGEGAARRRGRPRKSWLEVVKKDLQEVGIHDWQKEAQDRKKWRSKVKELQALGHQGL